MDRSKLFIILFAGTVLSPPVSADLTLPVPDRAVTVENIRGIARFTGSPLAADPGRPALPLYAVTFILPAAADLSTVSASIQGMETSVIQGVWQVAPAAIPCTRASGEPILIPGRSFVNGKDTAVYSADALYPAFHTGEVQTGELDGWKLVEVSLYPYRYNPVSQTLVRLTGGVLTISYGTTRSSATRSLRSGVRERLRSIAVNFSTGYDLPVSRSSAAAGGTFVIITTKNIAAKSGRLASFIAARQQRGFTVKTITEDVWGGGSGNTAAENLRAWLKQNYQPLGIEYALLIGNPHPVSGTVPMKMCYPSGDGPTDFYYAELSGNWDRDNDKKFGEYSDFKSTGGADKYGELLIGRIPCYNDADIVKLDKILDKCVRYESETETAWRKNCLIDMVPSDNESPMWQMGEEFKKKACVPRGWGSYRIYETNYNNTKPEKTPCSITNTVNAWTANRFGLCIWATHGNETEAMKIITSSNTTKLDDMFPTFTIESSCLNSHPETSGNLSTALLRNGAIGVLGCTRESLYDPGQTVFENTNSIDGIMFMIGKRIVYDSLTAGSALSETRGKTSVQAGYTWLNLLITNLYGDPSIGAYTSRSALAFMITAPRAASVFEVGERITLSWQNGTAPVSHVKIEFSPDSGVTWREVAASAVNTGEFTWVAPDVAASACMFRLSDAADPQIAVRSSLFSVFRTTAVSGLVISGAGLPQATVSCIAGGIVAQATTDSAGAFTFVKLIPGKVKLVAAIGKFTSDTVTCTVPPDKNDLQLEINAPQIAVSPPQVEITVVEGMTAERNIMISNAGRLALNYSLINVNAGSGVVLNEISVAEDNTPDGYELWNRGPLADISGWTLESSDNQRTSTTFIFPQGTRMKPDQTLLVIDDEGRVNDSCLYIGNNLWWTYLGDTLQLSAALYDQNSRCIDYFRSEKCTTAVPSGSAWNGAGARMTNNCIGRTANTDENSAADWTGFSTASLNARNPGQKPGAWISSAWLTLNRSGGVTSQRDSSAVRFTFSTATLAVNGVYHDTVIVSHDAINQSAPVRIPCRVTVVPFSAAGQGISGGSAPQVTPFIRAGQVSVRLFLPRRSRVALRLFSARGAETAAVAQRWYDAGYHTVCAGMAGTTLPQGMYILYITAGPVRMIRRITIVQ